MQHMYGELATLGHWPGTELVNNETKKLEAVETVWRDFYTGQHSSLKCETAWESIPIRQNCMRNLLWSRGTVGQEAVELICQNARKARQSETIFL